MHSIIIILWTCLSIGSLSSSSDSDESGEYYYGSMDSSKGNAGQYYDGDYYNYYDAGICSSEDAWTCEDIEWEVAESMVIGDIDGDGILTNADYEMSASDLTCDTNNDQALTPCELFTCSVAGENQYRLQYCSNSNLPQLSCECNIDSINELKENVVKANKAQYNSWYSWDQHGPAIELVDGCVTLKVITARDTDTSQWSVSLGDPDGETAKCGFNAGEITGDKSVKCCIPSDTYHLVCANTGGSGFGQGYVDINGRQFCVDYTSGDHKVQEVEIAGEGVVMTGTFYTTTVDLSTGAVDYYFLETNEMSYLLEGLTEDNKYELTYYHPPAQPISVRGCLIGTDKIQVSEIVFTDVNEWDAYYEDGYDDGDFLEEIALGTQISEAKFSGKKKVLIVKIRTRGDNKKVKHSLQELSDAVFGSAAFSMKQSYLDCSYNKMIFEPFVGTIGEHTISNGAIQVSVQGTATHSLQSEVQNNILKNKALTAIFGSTSRSARSMVDYIMFALPLKGTTSGAHAWAGVNADTSSYVYLKQPGTSNTYASAIMTPVTSAHEVGHNLGFRHSSTSGSTYGDNSGLQGNRGQHRTCFNAARSWYTGWYKDKHATWSSSSRDRVFKLVGVSEYSEASNRDYVVLRIDGSYFVSFNRLSGINANGDPNTGNKVNVVEHNGLVTTHSMLKGTLGVGQTLRMEKWTLTVKDIVTSGTKTHASIQVRKVNPGAPILCGTIPSSCQGHIDWAYNTGRKNENANSWYKRFDKITGSTLEAATKDHFQTYFYCKRLQKADCKDAGLQTACVNEQPAVCGTGVESDIASVLNDEADAETLTNLSEDKPLPLVLKVFVFIGVLSILHFYCHRCLKRTDYTTVPEPEEEI